MVDPGVQRLGRRARALIDRANGLAERERRDEG
jgi:hypothetical protein